MTRRAISCCASQVFIPQMPLALSIVTLSSTMLIHTGSDEAPSTTTPSHPAYFNWAVKRPPKLLCPNHSMGYSIGPRPWTSERPELGTKVPEKGEVIMLMTFRGSKPPNGSWSPTKSKKMAEPMPWPPPNASYCSVSILLIVLVVRLTLSILPVYPPAILHVLLFPSSSRIFHAFRVHGWNQLAAVHQTQVQPMIVAQVHIVTFGLLLVGGLSDKLDRLHGTRLDAGLFAARTARLTPIRSVDAQVAFGALAEWCGSTPAYGAAEDTS